MTIELKKCVICHEEIPPGKHNEHNAEPIESGRCCFKCNRDTVVPIRMGLSDIKHGGKNDNSRKN